MNKLEDIIYKVAEWICVAFMFLMVIIVVWTVIGRFVFNNTPAWGEELAITCMIWFGLLSSSLAEKDGTHIRVTIVDQIYPPLMVRICHIGFYFLKMAFAVIITWNSAKLVKFNKNVYMAGIHISESVIVASGVVMGALMVFFLICNFKKEVLNK